MSTYCQAARRAWCSAASAQGHRIDFQPPRLAFLPHPATNGNLVTQQRPRTRQRVPGTMHPQRLQQSIQGPSTGLQELVPDFSCKLPLVPLVGRNPLRQHRHQAPSARVVGRLPNRSQIRKQALRFVGFRPSGNKARTSLDRRRALGSVRRLPVIAQELLRLIQQLSFMFRPGTQVAPP